ncbi:hypothetical protein [Actinoplanes palleronii]|uniref:Uncharacterized protein n=1 Tax=Actinoplanes palleronii TaxID=113570 RepID=A0ABQ4BFX1_9ACTN|nr:hypothetical protein [Actinoplanes palleronii]GIE69564.1 hypothetical protein Apa02nite_056720 [Actinoplanes palleronii]
MFELAVATTAGVSPLSAGQLAIPLAAICLVAALFNVKQALAAIGPLVRALAAATAAAIAVGIALILIIAVMAQGH